MSTTYRTRGTGPRRVRCCIGGALVAALAVAGGFAVENAQAQERTRLNNVIEAIEQGRPAIAN